MLGITRQFFMPAEGEPYQIHFLLVYEPEPFAQAGYYTIWSDTFDDTEAFAAHIKATGGFNLAQKFTPRLYRINFSQV